MIDEDNKCVNQVDLPDSHEYSPPWPTEELMMSKKYNQVELTTNNFIKSLRSGFNNHFICIYEEQPFVVQLRRYQQNQHTSKIGIIFTSQWNVKVKQNSMMGDNVGTLSQSVIGQIKLQTAPYDCLQFQQNLWMVSNKSMPPRIYRLNQSSAGVENVASFHNKKKNSELYLSPIQLSVHHNRKGYAVGGGRRFLCSYNLQKQVMDTMYPAYDKNNISAVHMLDQNTVAVGTFEGAIDLLDLREPNQPSTARSMLRPHVDAVMSLASPTLNPHIFSSSARKDDFIYIWDSRSYGKQNSSFIHQLVIPRSGNQRISTTFSNDGKVLYTGSEQSQIVGWFYEQAHHIQRWRIEDSMIVNSVIYNNDYDSLIFSTGTRTYGQFKDDDQDDLMLNDTIKGQITRNMLGAIKLSKKSEQ